MRAIQRHRGPSKEEVHRFCASLGEEDGEDPHLVKRRRAHSKRSALSAAPSGRPERKVCQLCRQVALTLDEVLADCGDGVLRGLRVATVSPFPNASRLLVTVAPVGGRLTPDAGPKVVMEHLERASGHLLYEIAAAVTRKRAPLLHYRLAEPALRGNSFMTKPGIRSWLGTAFLLLAILILGLLVAREQHRETRLKAALARFQNREHQEIYSTLNYATLDPTSSPLSLVSWGGNSSLETVLDHITALTTRAPIRGPRRVLSVEVDATGLQDTGLSLKSVAKLPAVPTDLIEIRRCCPSDARRSISHTRSRTAD